MLVALARKLAISLWRYVETGLIPEGVVLAAPQQGGRNVTSTLIR
jgi:transposase